MGNEQTITLREADDGAAGRSPAPSLFFVLCADALGMPPWRHALAHVKEVILGRGDREASRSDGALVLRFPDRQMSSLHARLSRAAGLWFLADGNSKNGTFVNGRRIEKAPLADGDIVETGHTFWMFRPGVPGAAEAPHDREKSLVAAGGVPGMSTLSADLAMQLTELARVAPSPVPIFLTGETGTGKEVLARAAHGLSGRAGAYVAVNCGALPEALLEGAIFGHTKGAFTSAARDEPGLVRAADKGTLFLDEIGDLPLSSQPRFLRVLEEHEVTPVGSTRATPVDVRLISATHRDLEAQVGAGQFREDLWARLSGFTVRLPALRERREDLGLLAAGFLASKATLSRDAARALLTYPWPRNIRELARALEVATVRCGNGGVVDLAHLPDVVARAASTLAGSSSDRGGDSAVVAEGPRPIELPEIEADWCALASRFPEARSMKDLARLSGLAESTLRARRNKHGWPDLFSRAPRRRR